MSFNPIDLAIQVLSDKRAEIMSEVEYRLTQVRQIDSAIVQLQGSSISQAQSSASITQAEIPKEQTTAKTDRLVTNSDALGGYPFSGTWTQKIQFAIEANKRFMHNREIAEVIVKNEPSLDIKDVIGKLSIFLSAMKAKKKIDYYQVNNSNRNTFWGKSEWKNDKGKIKPGYEYNPAYVRDGASSLF